VILSVLSAVMPALVAGIHVLKRCKFKDVDGGDKRAFTLVFGERCPIMTMIRFSLN
jgi:hypothetical protein